VSVAAAQGDTERLLAADRVERLMAAVRTVCGWCPRDRQTVIVDVPADERGVSHGICPSCKAKLDGQIEQKENAMKSEQLSLDQLIDGVKKHALEHYEENGWDIVVECFGRDELIPLLREAGAATLEDAIEAVGEIAKLHDERRREIRSTAW
jgi:hypothetical protein